MPNWCEGELKVRGKKKNIIRFMEEGIQPMTPLAENLEKIKFTQGKYSTYTMSTCKKKYLIIEAGRAFIDEFMIEFENLESDETDILVEAFPARYQKYHCGNFTIDDITYSGGSSGHKCSIKGISLPASQGFQTGKVSKTWEKVTVKQIAEEIKGKYGMTDLFFWAGEPIIEKIDQEEQADSEFISKLCNDQGLFIKIYKKALVIFDKTIYEGRGITATYSEHDFEEWAWNTTLVGTYTGAKIAYTQVNKKAKKKEEKTKVISVTVGDETRLLVLNEKADSKEEAERIAKAKVNAENEKAITLEFTALGDANIVASCNIEVKGMGRIDGKYYVTKVSHELSGGSGHKMQVSAYKIFERL